MNAWARWVWLVRAGLVIGSGWLWGQNEICCIVEELIVPVITSQVEFDHKSGRGLGMAGAFVSIADDTTAALVNPSGLSQLARPGLASSLMVAGDNPRLFPLLALAYPYRRWTLAVGYSQPANLRVKEGDALRPLGGPGFGVDLEIEQLGLALSYIVSRRFFVGAGINHHRMQLQVREGFEPGVNLSQDVDDTDEGLHAGFLARFNQSWRLGAYWRQGLSFHMRARREAGNGFAANDLERSYRVGARYGAGLFYRPLRPLIFQLQVDFQERERGLDASLPVVARDLLGILLDPPGGDFALDDVGQYRLGIEYSFWNKKRIPAIRTGLRWDDAAGVYFVPTRDTELNARYQELFPNRAGRWYYSAGVGLIPREGLAVELGAEWVADDLAVSLLVTKRL